jgi:uncharacterized membrane protein
MLRPPPARGLSRRFAVWFGRGLLITAPTAVTIYLCWVIIRWVDGLIGTTIPGVGLVVAILAITAIGALATNVVTRAALGFVDDLLERVPFVRLLYTSTKDLINAFVGDKRRFTRAVRVALTEDGAVTVLGFVTAESLGELGLPGQVAVYLPQSYNFAGNLIVVPASRVTPVAADSGEVMTFIVSGGVSGGAGSRQPHGP